MKRILLSSLSAFIYLVGQSQTFTPEIGLNYMYQPHDFYILRSYGITYTSRLNFWEGKNSSLSVGFPISVGWSNFKNPHFAEADMAAEIDYNFGSGSTKASKKRFGFFGGAGYAYHMTIIHPAPLSTYPAFPVPLRNAIERNYFTDAVSDNNIPVSMFGPTLHAGIRLPLGHAGKTIEFRVSYMKILDMPGFLQDWYYDYYGTILRKTEVLGLGCLISF